MFEEKSYLLKPCPFCGGRAIIAASNRLNGEIKCTKCKGRFFSYFVPDNEHWTDSVIAAWNSRKS